MGKLKFVYIVYGFYFSLRTIYNANIPITIDHCFSVNWTFRIHRKNSMIKKRTKTKKYKIQYIASKLSAPTNSPSWTLPIKFDYCAFSSFFIKQSNFQLSFPSFSPVFTNKFIIELHVRSKHLPRLWFFHKIPLHFSITIPTFENDIV